MVARKQRPFADTWGSLAGPPAVIYTNHEPSRDQAIRAIRFLRRTQPDADLIMDILGLSKYDQQAT